MLNKRNIRIAAGLVVLVVLVFSVAPSLYLFNSVDGVVNGRISILKSPIEGGLAFSKETEYGTFFKKGELIGTVTNDRVSQSFLHELITEKKTLEARIVSLEKRIATFTELNASLRKDLEAYREFSIRRITLQIAQDQDALAEEDIENKRAKAEYEATKVLDDRNAVPKRELEKHEAAFNSSTQRLLRNKSLIAELTNSLEAVRAGTFLGDGNNDSPYSKQRMDQLVIEISLAETACNEAKNRLSGINLQIEEERERIAKAEKFELFAPYDALVWRMPSIEGSTIVIDSELVILLDCESVFLDVTVSESQFSNVKPGDEIRYQLMGGTTQYVGTVFALRGSGSVQGDLNLAASVSKDSKREFRIWIHADPADLGLTPQTFFQIGRRVVVKIPRKWNPLSFLDRFINVF